VNSAFVFGWPSPFCRDESLSHDELRSVWVPAGVGGAFEQSTRGEGSEGEPGVDSLLKRCSDRSRRNRRNVSLEMCYIFTYLVRSLEDICKADSFIGTILHGCIAAFCNGLELARLVSLPWPLNSFSPGQSTHAVCLSGRRRSRVISRPQSCKW